MIDFFKDYIVNYNFTFYWVWSFKCHYFFLLFCRYYQFTIFDYSVFVDYYYLAIERLFIDKSKLSAETMSVFRKLYFVLEYPMFG